MPAYSVRSAASERHITRIDLSRISANPFQPRRSFDEASIRELAESIRTCGLLSPLLVRRTNAGEYELIAGERRFRAMQLLQYEKADTIIISAYDRDCALIALIENLQREELHFLDQAAACRRIITEHGLTQEELAAAIGKSPSALANLLRLTKLGGDVQSRIRAGQLSERHARALLRLNSDAERLKYAENAIKKQLTVRQLEALIDQQKREKPASRLVGNSRLVINAVNSTVRQLKQIGVRASSRVEEYSDHYDIIITVKCE